MAALFYLFLSPPPRSAALCDNNIAVIMVCDPDIAFPQRWLMAIVIFQNCLYKQHTESSTKRILMSSAKLFLSQATFLQSIVDTWTFVWPGCTVLCYEFLMWRKQLMAECIDCVCCMCFAFSSPLPTFNLNIWVESWWGGKEWRKDSNHPVRVHECENVDELCIL